jgi:phage tail-like protein
MSSNANSKEDGSWPVPQFRFEVDLGTGLDIVKFQDVSGLDVESAIVEYRKGNSPLFSATKMPGIAKHGNITLKTGVFANDNRFWEWHKEISSNAVKKRTISIRLLDEGGRVVMQWQLHNALPTKITGADVKSEGNEVVVNSIEITHEQLTITNS